MPLSDFSHFQKPENAIRAFDDLFRLDGEWVLAFAGFSGHGKTTLLEWLKTHSLEMHFNYGFLDFDYRTHYLSILDRLIEQIITLESPNYKYYRDKRNEILENRDEREISVNLTQLMQDATNSTQTINANMSEFALSLDSMARDRLTDVWLDSIATSQPESKKLVFFFDTFERYLQLSSEDDIGWFWDTLNRLHNRLPQIRIVVASQTSEISFRPAKVVTLGAFSKEQSDALLISMGINDSDYINIVFQRIASGHPLVTSLAGNLWQESEGRISTDDIPELTNTDDAIRWVQAQIIERLNEPLKSSVRWGVILRYFNLDLINVVLADSKLNIDQFNKLINYSFVVYSQDASCWTFHKLLRQVQIGYLRVVSPEQFKLYHDYVMQYYFNRQDFEFIYHLFFVDPNTACSLWGDLAQANLLLTNEFTEKLFQIVEEDEIILEEARKLEIEYLQGKKYLMQGQQDVARHKFMWVEENSKRLQIGYLSAHSLLGLATVESYEHNLDEARDQLLGAKAIYEEINDLTGIVNVFQSLAKLEMMSGNDDKAIDYYNSALDYGHRDKNILSIAHSLRGLGELMLKRDKDRASELLQEALEIYRKIEDFRGKANVLILLPETLDPSLSDYERKARKYFNDAIALYESVRDTRGKANCYFKLGHLELNVSAIEFKRNRNEAAVVPRINQAINYFNQAVALYKKVKDPLGQANILVELGDAYIFLGDETVVLGKQSFERALETYRNIGNQAGIKRAEYKLQEWEEQFGLETQQILNTIRGWLQTPNKVASQAYVTEHRDILLSDKAERKLEALAIIDPAEQVKFYQLLLQDCRKYGIDQAYSRR